MAKKKTTADELELIGRGGPQPTTEDLIRKEFDMPQVIGRGGPQPTADSVMKEAFDPTTQPVATTQQDVDSQDAKTRLWQQLEYAYGNQLKKSDEAYDQAYSQADRQALARGMGRSSYNNQTLANLAAKKIEAQNEIGEAKIAAYQSGLNTLEQQEKEDEWRQKQWDYQLERDKVSDERYAEERDYSRSRDEISDRRYEDELAYGRERD